MGEGDVQGITELLQPLHLRFLYFFWNNGVSEVPLVLKNGPLYHLGGGVATWCCPCGPTHLWSLPRPRLTSGVCHNFDVILICLESGPWGQGVALLGAISPQLPWVGGLSAGPLLATYRSRLPLAWSETGFIFPSPAFLWLGLLHSGARCN